MELVRKAVEDGASQDVNRHTTFAGKAVADDTTAGHARDWEYLSYTAGSVEIDSYSAENFLDAMMAMIGVYSESRYEKFWAAVATRQRDFLPVNGRWTQDERYRVRFRGFLRESNGIYRKAISQRARDKGDKPLEEEDSIDDYCRGALQEAQTAQVITHFAGEGKAMYAHGALFAYGALLRHEELAEALVENIFIEKGEYMMKITGGKWRKTGETDEVWFEGCKSTMKKVIAERKHGLLLPGWNSTVALAGIKKCKEKHEWAKNRTWDWHCFRHGKAVDMRLRGVPKAERMRRGRWRSEKIEDLYSRHR